MQSNQQHLRPLRDPPFTSFFSQSQNVDFTPFFSQSQNVDFQPSKICPRNFIIFDRTDNHSQIMFHPGSTLPANGYIQHTQNDVNAPGEVSSILKEDSADIDLLMSYEEDEDEEEYEEEEDEVSTARTHGNDVSDTADSCAVKLPGNCPGRGRGRGSKLGLSISSCKSSSSSDRKRREMKKMVDSLRGIVPGSKRLNTVDVLDEAVKYLKSIKVELQKVGVANVMN